MSPLKTIFVLAVGPLASEVVLVLQSLVTSFFVARTIDHGMEVFGAIFAVEFLAIALSRYLLDSITLRFSYLFGESRYVDCDQLFVDFVRVCVLFGIITPCIVLPATVPIIEWFGADPALSYLCKQYMWPVTAGCFGNFLFMTCCGLIEAEGRSILFGIIQFASFALNTLLLYIALIVLKLPIWGASLAIISSQTIPGLILAAFIFAGKLTIHPKFSMFFKKFSPELLPGLLMGLANFISELSEIIPTLLMQKYFFAAARAIGCYDVIAEVWAATERLYECIGCICNGFTEALQPAASYAYGAKRLNRTMWLSIHMLWITTVLTSGLSMIMIFFPEKVGLLWSKDPEFLGWLSKTLPKVFYAIPCIPMAYMVPQLLAAIQRVKTSIIMSFIIMIFPYPCFSTILYFSNKKDPARTMFTYPLSDIFGFIIGSVVLIKPLCEMIRAPKDEELSPLLSTSPLLQSCTSSCAGLSTENSNSDEQA